MAKIMIVDDDPDIRLSAQLSLNRAGYETVEATSGQDALEKVKAERPDLIILDAMMDSTTDGFQVALKLHNTGADSEYAEFVKTPILMVTAIHKTSPIRFGPDEDYLPVDAFIEKPIMPDVLVERVRAMLQDEAIGPPQS